MQKEIKTEDGHFYSVWLGKGQRGYTEKNSIRDDIHSLPIITVRIRGRREIKGRMDEETNPKDTYISSDKDDKRKEKGDEV